jgi:excisionase family DNA binding protein
MAVTDDHLLTVEEVAERARVSSKTVYRAIWSGRLKAYRVGGQWRITESAMWAWIEAEAA